jgi:hypothetical protein
MYDGILIDVAFAGFFLAKVTFNNNFTLRGRTDDESLCSGWENKVS